MFKNYNSGLCFEDEGSYLYEDNQVEQWYCQDGNTRQEWTMIPVPGLQYTYYIQNRWNGTGYCLGIPGFGTANGAPLEVLPCDWAADQQWIFNTGHL